MIKLHETDKAVADSSKAIRLEPRMIHGDRDRAVQYEKKGDLEKAKADREQARKLECEGVKETATAPGR